MNKEVYILGDRAREHAIGAKIRKDRGEFINLHFFPGTGGTLDLGINNSTTNFSNYLKETIQLIRSDRLVIVGPEVLLEKGVVNSVQELKVPIFGPTKDTAKLEWSKGWAQGFLEKYNIPHAKGQVFGPWEMSYMLGYITELNGQCVIKADGLAGGKGVWVCSSYDQALEAIDELFNDQTIPEDSKRYIVVQEKLEGKEVSIMAFCDGKTALPMIPSIDNKRLLDDDKGPNTGGMGAYAPAWNIVNQSELEQIRKKILQPTIDAMRELGKPFTGVLYPALFKTKEGFKVIEFNTRFGSPEIEAVLPLLKTDLIDIVEACIGGDLGNAQLLWDEKFAVCVVLATKEYPNYSNVMVPIKGLTEIIKNPVDDLEVYHSQTYKRGYQYYAKGGRILSVVGKGSTLKVAVDKSYSVIENPLEFKRMQYRKDIAKKALET